MSKFKEIPDDGVEMETNNNPSARSSEVFFEARKPRWLWPVVILSCILCIVGLVCIIVAVTKPAKTSSCAEKTEQVQTHCQYSSEAKRVNLEEFLKEVQSTYFKMNPDNVAWQPGVTDRFEHVKAR